MASLPAKPPSPTSNRFCSPVCAERWDLQAVALTRGDRGALLLRGAETDDCAGVRTSVADTVGAGDAFTSRFALGLLASEPLAEINQKACEIAAYVCSQHGATPQLADHHRCF